MSITFAVRGSHRDIETGEGYVNCSNVNARDLLVHLGLNTSEDMYGSVRGAELRSICNAALELPEDEAIEGNVEGRLINCGRRPGYLRGQTKALLALALDAGDLGLVNWG